MAYGLKYSCDFDSNITSYTLEIYQKDYAGSATTLTGSSNPVTHTWETDDPKAPIKGSSLAMSFINEGNIPLSDLYSTNDEEFKAKLIWHTGVTDITMFEGFIVQDDSSELMVDYNHEISLSANDNLGLLKDVTFDQVPFYTLENTFTSQYAEGTATNLLALDAVTGAALKVGDRLIITGSNIDGTYTVVSFGAGVTYNVIVKETVNVSASVTTATIEVYSADLYTLQTLNSFIKNCILATGLELEIQEFVNINEVSQSNTGCFLDQTLLDPQTFYNGSTWEDCYAVLTKILERFNCTLFQAKGVWNIVRWPELMDYGYPIPGFVYDASFTFLGTVKLNEEGTSFGGWDKYLIGIGETSVAENGLLQRISRPFKYTKETFNYRQPPELLRNANLQQLGNLIRTYTTGSGSTLKTISEYEMPWWTIIAGSFTGTSEYFIRVVKDNLNNEIDRCAVLKNGSIESFTIQAAQGDGFSFSFSVITTNSQPGNVGIVFQIKDHDGTQTKYLQDVTLTWLGSVGYTVNVPSTDNTNTTHSFDISGTIPYDGLLTVSLMDFDQSGGSTAGETQYRNLSLSYTPMINQSTKIIGQTHTSLQNTITKNDNERDITIDASPRNSIAGTLFLNSLTGLLQTRAGQWNRKTRTESKNLGEITTEENLFLRRIPRTLLEGTFYGLISKPQTAAGPTIIVDHITLLTLIRYTYFSDRNFIFGRLEINYRENTASGILYEMYKDTETDSDLAYYYTFQFLYASK